MQIFIVVGSTGEGPDHTSWNAKAFRDPVQAQAHIDEIQEELKRLTEVLDVPSDTLATFSWFVIDEGQVRLWNNRHRKVDSKLPSLDPDFRSDYTGVWYRMEELELVDAQD